MNIDCRDNGEDHGRGDSSILSLSRHTCSTSAYIGQLYPIFPHHTAAINANPITLLPTPNTSSSFCSLGPSAFLPHPTLSLCPPTHQEQGSRGALCKVSFFKQGTTWKCNSSLNRCHTLVAMQGVERSPQMLHNQVNHSNLTFFRVIDTNVDCPSQSFVPRMPQSSPLPGRQPDLQAAHGLVSNKSLTL